MNWIQTDSYEDLSAAGADFLAALAAERPEGHWCLTTGGSPTGTFRGLAERGVALDRLWITKLDEWIGVPPVHPATCEFYLREHVLGPWGIREDRYLAFDGLSTEPEAEVARVQRELDSRERLQVAVLGIGKNGHIGLNEPQARLHSRCHIAQIAEETRRSGAVAEMPEPPTQGMTLGLGDLFRAEHILLLIAGEGKGNAARALRSGRIETSVPATLLHLHPQVTVICEPRAWV